MVVDLVGWMQSKVVVWEVLEMRALDNSSMLFMLEITRSSMIGNIGLFV